MSRCGILSILINSLRFTYILTEMISSVNAFLGFDQRCLPPNEMMVIGQREQAGSFLLHHVVNGVLKGNREVCIASLVQKFHHYNIISQKLGASLQTAKDAGKCSFVDGLSLLSDALFPCEHKSKVSLDAREFLNNFKELLSGQAKGLSQEEKSSPVLVIDELSVLLSLGFGLEDICLMVEELLDCVHMISTSAKPAECGGLSVVIMCTHDESDKDSEALWSHLVHLSSICVDVKGLDTGYCKDVHGQATVTWRDGLSRPRRPSSRTLQFKVMETGAEFFAAGTSVAVL